jgi:hypothetical protein
VAWLIDLTDQRFKIPANADVVGYIARANPFAHSDLGQRLIDLKGTLSEATVYSPSFKICAYVVLHNPANVIFAFAADMRDLSFRLPPAMHGEMLALGRANPSRIGGEWLDIAAFPSRQTTESEQRLADYCAAALRHAAMLDPDT